MDGTNQVRFDLSKYLTSSGTGRRVIRYKAKQVFFSQGSPADAVFYIHSGRAKLTVVSKRGKEATVTLLASGDFVGEESISEPSRVHTATARAITACVVLKISSAEMLRVMHCRACVFRFVSEIHGSQEHTSPG
jgi:CRP-like cAMP-binding protein